MKCHRTLLLALQAAMMPVIFWQTAAAQDQRPHFATDTMRREISPAKPAFLRIGVGYESVPEDLRPYLVQPVTSPDQHEAMRAMSDAGIYFMLSGGHRDDLRTTRHKNLFLSREEKEALFETYPYLLGFNYWEPSLDQFAYDNVAEALEVVAKYGGYLNLNARGHQDLIGGIAARNPAFAALMRKHADHIILTARMTTTSNPMVSLSDTLGGVFGGLGSVSSASDSARPSSVGACCCRTAWISKPFPTTPGSWRRWWPSS